jgi:hypothetical protein
MDGNYQTYINRVVQMTLPSNYEQQLHNIQPSPKFKQGQPVEFPGFSVITPPWAEENVNDHLYKYLEKVTMQLEQELGKNLFIALPSSTFHLTIVDLIWEKSYLNALKEKSNFDQLLIKEITKIFKQYQETIQELNSLELEVLGLSIFPRAISVCLAPTETSYKIIIKLRQLIYQAEQIIKLGIEQQYDFVAHVTLGYFGEIGANLDFNQVQSTLTKINEQWLDEAPPLFQLKTIELRKFNDMITYNRQEDWPTIQL